MIGPDHRTAPAEVAAKWEQSSDIGVDTSHQEYDEWWHVFNDDTLVKLINLSYRQSLTLRAAGVRVLEARAQLGQAIGEL